MNIGHKKVRFETFVACHKTKVSKIAKNLVSGTIKKQCVNVISSLQ